MSPPTRPRSPTDRSTTCSGSSAPGVPDADSEPHLEWARQIGAAIMPYAAGGVYVNALGDEPAGRVRAAYGSNWQRLAEIKRRYDPDNVFGHNANMQPVTG